MTSEAYGRPQGKSGQTGRVVPQAARRAVLEDDEQVKIIWCVVSCSCVLCGFVGGGMTAASTGGACRGLARPPVKPVEGDGEKEAAWDEQWCILYAAFPVMYSQASVVL